MTFNILSVLGMIFNVIGFCLIGFNLLKHPDNWPFLGGGSREATYNRGGFVMIIVGSVLQLLGELIPAVVRL